MNKNVPVEFISLKPCLFGIKNELFAEFDAFKVDAKGEAPTLTIVAVEVDILNIIISMMSQCTSYLIKVYYPSKRSKLSKVLEEIVC